MAMANGEAPRSGEHGQQRWGGWHSPIASRSARGRLPNAVAGGCERKPVPSSCAPTRTARGPTRLLTPERIADARTVDELAAFDGVRGSAPQNGLLGDDLRRRVAEDLQRRIEAGQLPDILSGLQLNILRAPDAQLPHVVRDALQTRPDAVARRVDLEHQAGGAAPVAIRGAPRAARGHGHGGDTRS